VFVAEIVEGGDDCGGVEWWWEGWRKPPIFDLCLQVPGCVSHADTCRVFELSDELRTQISNRIWVLITEGQANLKAIKVACSRESLDRSTIHSG